VRERERAKRLAISNNGCVCARVATRELVSDQGLVASIAELAVVEKSLGTDEKAVSIG